MKPDCNHYLVRTTLQQADKTGNSFVVSSRLSTAGSCLDFLVWMPLFGECASLHTPDGEFLLEQKTSLLLRTTDILVRSDTLSSGTEAAGLNRSDISALPQFAIKSVDGGILLMMQRSSFPCRKPFEIDC